jgi:hypothetical protein
VRRVEGDADHASIGARIQRPQHLYAEVGQLPRQGVHLARQHAARALVAAPGLADRSGRVLRRDLHHHQREVAGGARRGAGDQRQIGADQLGRGCQVMAA